MESPYLVKRFVSSDKVPGASTFYYWIFSPHDNTQKIGIGEFFEVVSAEVDEKTCEYIGKRLWETFIEKYTDDNFEQALQRTSFTLISVLKELGIEQIDINFAFWAIKQNTRGKYLLYLAIIGQADIVLIRDGKPIFLHEYAPANDDLRDLKYVELDIEAKDKILVSNRFLLENLLKTDVLDLTSDASLLETLKEAEANFPGGQGIFFLGIELQEDLSRTEKAKAQKGIVNILSHSANQGVLTPPDKAETVNTRTLADILHSIGAKIKVRTRPVAARVKRFIARIKNKKQKQRNSQPSTYNKKHGPIGVITSDLSKYVENTGVPTGAEEPNLEDDQHVMTSPRAEVDDKTGSQSTLEPKEADSYSPAMLRLKRVWWGRVWLAISKVLRPLLYRRKHRALYVDGRLGVRRASLRLRLVYLAGTLFVFFVVFSLIKSYHNKREEKRQTTVFIQKEILPVIKLYNEQVKPIELSDPNHILDLCRKTVNDAINKMDQYTKKLAYAENKKRVTEYTSQLNDIKNKCLAKYDMVHHIVRVKTAKVVKDFAADLGVEVDIASIIEQKGYLYAVDRGKKAVYRVNPETGRAIKLEDPDGLLRDPIEIGVNKDRVLVCDRISGILEFRDGKFKAVVGTSPEALGSKCVLVRGFYTNAYFVLEDRSSLYKSAGVASGYALPVVYVKNIKQVLDVAIDGNIYVLRESGDSVKLERYFQGVLDRSFRFKGDLSGYSSLYTNPSGSFPIYVLNPKQGTILVIEKPTSKRHPGYGVVLRQIVLDNKDLFGDIEDFAVNLGVDNNKEEYLYFVSKNVLWRVGLQDK